MKSGIIKRNNRHRSNRPRPSSQNNSLDRGFDKDFDCEERLDYRPPRNRVVLQQNIDKYLNLARESMSTGDRVQAESYLQHADHFNRLLNEQKEIKQQFDQKRLQTMNAASAAQALNDDLKPSEGSSLKAEQSAIEDQKEMDEKEDETE